MDREQEMKAAALSAIEKRYGTHLDKMRAFSSELESACGFNDGFKAGAEWEAEREKSVSVDQAKEYTYQWLLNKGLHDLGSYLSFDDVFHLLADFANTNPTNNK